MFRVSVLAILAILSFGIVCGQQEAPSSPSPPNTDQTSAQPSPEQAAPKSKKPASKTEKPAPKTEKPAPKSEKPAPKIEKPAPKIEKPAPKIEMPAPKIEMPAPKSEKPAPKSEKPAPKSEKPAPKSEKPAPKSEKPAPKSEKPAPKSEKPAPKSEKPAPKSEKPAPKSEKPAPKSEKPAPKSEKPASKSEKPEPKSEKPAPKSEKPAPKSEKPASKSEKPEPKSEKPAPKSEKLEPKSEKPAPKSETPAENQPSLTAALPPLDVERNVYVPYHQLESVFEKDGRGVILPYREFLQLWRRAIGQEIPEPEPIVGGLVRSALYRTTFPSSETVGGITIEVDLEVEALTKNWSRIPLGPRQFTIAAAKTGAASLLMGDDGYEVMVPKAGVYPIKLFILAPASSENGVATARVQLPRAALSRFEGIAPGKGWEFALSDDIPFTQSAEDQDTKLEFLPGRIEKLDISWQKRPDDGDSIPQILADTEIRTNVIGGAIQTTVDIDYRILRTGVDSFELTVPASHELLSVEGERLKDWKMEYGEATHRVMVRLTDPAWTRYNLRLVLEKNLDELPATAAVPQVETIGVMRQSGVLELRAPRDLEVRVEGKQGLTAQPVPEDSSELIQGSFRFLNAPYQLSLNIAKTTPRVLVQSTSILSLKPGVANLSADFNYTVERAPVYETKLVLPEGFSHAEVSGSQVEEFTLDGRQLHMVFKRKQLGDVRFSVTASAPLDDNASVIAPVIEVDGAFRYEGKLGVVTGTSLQAAVSDVGEFRPLDPAILGSSATGAEPVLGFAYREDDSPATIRLQPRAPLVSVSISQLVRIQQEAIHSRWWIDYQILHAGAERFTLGVPKAIADRLRVEGSFHKEVIKNYQPDGASDDTGLVYWQLRMKQKKQSDFQLQLSLRQPLAEIPDEGSLELPIPELVPADVIRHDYLLAISKDPSLQLAGLETSGLEPAVPEQLTGPLEGVAADASFYQSGQTGGSLTVALAKSRLIETPKAIITYADISHVVSSDGAITCETIYWVRNRSEKALRVKLPGNAQVAAAVFGDKSDQRRISKSGDGQILIPLPNGSENQQRAIPVRLVYEIRSLERENSLPFRGDLWLAAPEVLNAGVLQTQVRLFLPPGYRYLDIGGPYELKHNSNGWREVRQQLDFLIPALGPDTATGELVPWQAPPPYSGEADKGFTIPVIKEGLEYTLHRLNGPAPIKIFYLSAAVAAAAEAVLCLLVLAIGVFLTRSILEKKLVFLIFAGLLPLALAGMAAPHLADAYRAVFLGAAASVVVWLLAGLWWLIKPGAESEAQISGATEPKREESATHEPVPYPESHDDNVETKQIPATALDEEESLGLRELEPIPGPGSDEETDDDGDGARPPGDEPSHKSRRFRRRRNQRRRHRRR